MAKFCLVCLCDVRAAQSRAGAPALVLCPALLSDNCLPDCYCHVWLDPRTFMYFYIKELVQKYKIQMKIIVRVYFDFFYKVLYLCNDLWCGCVTSQRSL